MGSSPARVDYKRFESIDQFRGFAIAAMVLVNVLGRFSVMPDFLRHARYLSLNFADAVAPFFFFVVGMGLRLWWTRNRPKLGAGRAALLVIKRCAALMVLAVFVYHFEMRRIFWDALSQIAFGCLIALPVIGAGQRWRLSAPFIYAGALVLFTNGKTRLLGVPFEIESASWPLMILAGSFVADWLEEDAKAVLINSVGAGTALTAAGLLLYRFAPGTVVSCALVYLGASFLLAAGFHYLADVRGLAFAPLTTLGRNALIVYALHYYVDDDMRRLIPDSAGLAQAFLAFAVVFGTTYAVARYLKERRIFITV